MVDYLADQNIEIDIYCFDNGNTKVKIPNNVNLEYISRSKINSLIMPNII